MDALYTAKESIHQLIQRLKLLYPRSVGNQWRIPQIHEQLHIAHNTYLFGAHQNATTMKLQKKQVNMFKKESKHLIFN